MHGRIVHLISFLLSMLSCDLKAMELVVVSDAFCPYICDDPKSPGFVVELSKAIFEPEGYQVSFQILPWLRAMRQVQFDSSPETVYLSFWHDKTEELYSSALPVSVLRVCFFTGVDSDWIWRGSDSKLGSLGIAKGIYLAPEVEKYVIRNRRQIHYIVSDAPLVQSIKMLVTSRVRIIYDAASVVSYNAIELGLEKSLRLAGCIGIEHPFYLVLSKKVPNGEVLLKAFDKGYLRLRLSGQLSELRNRYHLDDWRSIYSKPLK